MFSKIKKVLTSLALAASLVLAPMNVYAETKEGKHKGADGYLYSDDTDTNELIDTQIYVKIEPSHKWTVVVPGSFYLAEDNKDSQDQPTPFEQQGAISIKEDSMLGSKTLKVTPKCKMVTDTTAPNDPRKNFTGMPIDVVPSPTGKPSGATTETNAETREVTVKFSADRKGAANLTVSISQTPEEGAATDLDKWKNKYCPDGLNNVNVANITYAIELAD